MKQEDEASGGATLQDWLDIVWQSAIQAQGKGLDVQFVNLGASVGIRIFGVEVRDGRPYLVAAQPEIQHVNPGTNGAANATVLSGQDAQPLGVDRP